MRAGGAGTPLASGGPARADAGSRTAARPSRTDAGTDAPRRRRLARRLLVLLTVAAVVAALARSLLVQSFVVPTGSMDPTVRPGDRVLVSRLSYRVGEIERGDVIVFDGAGVFDPAPEPPRTALSQAGRGIAAAFSLPVGAHDYLKRVVGLPGERVACCDAAGRITVDGKPLVEPYLRRGEAPSAVRFDVVVPPGRLWVLGDHRAASADSRAHLGDAGGGTVPVDHVVGRVVGIYWPMAHAGAVDRGPERPSSAGPTAEGRP
jgi:signal peptidase I